MLSLNWPYIWSADVEARLRSDFRISCVTPHPPWLVVVVPKKDKEDYKEELGYVFLVGVGGRGLGGGRAGG